MAKAKKINVAAFERQLAENVIGDDSLKELQVNAEESVWIKIPVDLNDATGSAIEDMRAQIIACGDDADAAALVLLAGHPTFTAEDQLETWKSSGRSAGLLMQMWAVLTRETMQNLQDFRYRG